MSEDMEAHNLALNTRRSQRVSLFACHFGKFSDGWWHRCREPDKTAAAHPPAGARVSLLLSKERRRWHADCWDEQEPPRQAGRNDSDPRSQVRLECALCCPSLKTSP